MRGASIFVAMEVKLNPSLFICFQFPHSLLPQQTKIRLKKVVMSLCSAMPREHQPPLSCGLMFIQATNTTMRLGLYPILLSMILENIAVMQSTDMEMILTLPLSYSKVGSCCIFGAGRFHKPRVVKEIRLFSSNSKWFEPIDSYHGGI